MKTDRELLRQYAELRDEAAFAEIVRRQTDFVYSIALRVTLNGALAQDATQTVFAQLAQQAAALGHYDTLLGWLHTTARNRAINLVRGEERRRAREHEAASMPDHATTRDVNWAEIAPLLDEAVGSLPESDRQAVLLRFFQGWSHQQVGVTLGLSEDAARKRIERALEKLRGFFARRGVTATSVLLAATITENSVQAAPAGLAESATQASLVGATAITTESLFLKILLMSTKTKFLLAAAVVLLAAIPLFLIWYPANQVSGATPANSAAPAPTVAASAAAVAKAPATSIAPPVVNATIKAVAAQPVVAPVPTVSANDDPQPQTDLHACIVQAAKLMTTNNFVGFVKALMSPDDIQKMIASGQATSIEDFAAQSSAEPGESQMMMEMGHWLEAIEDQSPEMNADGTQATFKMGPSVDKKAPPYVAFIKVNGYWYLDE
jgi:RNA polymerase sigma factor (sigma-70 family)